MSADSRFHLFAEGELAGVELPRRFTYPFCYVPHRLCEVAAEHLRQYLDSRDDWRDELQGGKMMGVLVVERDGHVGYLAAYSGNLAHCYDHDFFVPAVCDLLSVNGFFAPEEKIITEINHKIAAEISSPERTTLVAKLEQATAECDAEVAQYKTIMKESKARRDIARREGADAQSLIAESQFQKAELRRIQQRHRTVIDDIKVQIDSLDAVVAELKAERHRRSVALQRLVFERFEMLNARGESRNLNQIFADTPQGAPPSGAGECAAPKLLQYAYANGYKPCAMAEFWVGQSPKDEVRRHGCYYPSCKAKCGPILGWMLQGLDVDPNPLESMVEKPVEVLYEDEWVVAVDKPEGMLSVPGKLSADSLQERVQRMFGQEMHIVHRLDMATSGVLLFARTAPIHRQLQSMFKSRDIEKCYVALLDAEMEPKSGSIDLPLVLNPDDRPRQMVSYTHGKQALTRYEIVGRENGRSRVMFYPITGRTHQLRVHAAHCDGLDTPIAGDTLYGTVADRLYLHAHWVKFVHPVTQKEVKIESKVPF
jgi:tRNA pseudouridine32 synthase/23S rRNA pseudouridine746 synthase